MWMCTDPWRIWNPFCNVSSPCCCCPCFQDLLQFFPRFFFLSSSSFLSLFNDHTRLSMQNNGTHTFSSLCSLRTPSLLYRTSSNGQTKSFTIWRVYVNHRFIGRCMTREDVFGEDGRSRERRWIRLFADTNKISRLALLLSRKKRKKRKLSRDINTGLIEYSIFLLRME